MRSDTVFDTMLQHERTTLAWERTAFTGIIVGSLMTRVGAGVHVLIGGVGLVFVCAAGGLLIWTGRNYDALHGPLRAGESPVHPRVVAAVGVLATLATVAATAIALTAIVAG